MQVEISYCAATVILTVLLIMPKTLPAIYGHGYLSLSILQASVYQLFHR